MDAPEDRSKALNEHMSSGFAPRADIVAAYRQVRGLRAFENAAGINADLKKHICNIHAVAHQQAGFDHLTVDATRRYSVACRQGRKLDAAADKERVGGDEEGICRSRTIAEKLASISGPVLALST